MTQAPVRCLILACGNRLRSDDGVGPWLAAWAEERFRADPAVRVVSRQQWTPDLAEEISCAASVLFLDCSAESAPGSIQCNPVAARSGAPALATHHLVAPELLALSRELYASLPSNALLLTIGAGSTELGEEFSPPVKASLPQACNVLEMTVLDFLAGKSQIE